MFKLFLPKTHKELETLVIKTINSMSNNYKDAAQEYFEEFCRRFGGLADGNELNEKQISYYTEIREQLSEELKEFTHKDQKPYWS